MMHGITSRKSFVANPFVACLLLFVLSGYSSAFTITTEQGVSDSTSQSSRKIEVINSKRPEGASSVTQTNPVPAPIVIPSISQESLSVTPGMAIKLNDEMYLTDQGIYKALENGAILTPDGLVIQHDNGALITLPVVDPGQN